MGRPPLAYDPPVPPPTDERWNPAVAPAAGVAGEGDTAGQRCRSQVEPTDPAPDTAASKPIRRRATELPGNLAGKSLPHQVWVLAVWPFMELVFNALVGIIDTALAGRMEAAKAATDAIGVAAYVGWLLGMLHMAVGVGAAALIARAVGARRYAVANAGLGQGLLLGLVWGTLIGGAVYLAAPGIAAFFKLAPGAHAMAVEYLRITTLAVPIAAILFVGTAALRAAGDTRTPFFAMFGVNLVNIAVSATLVFAPAPFGGYGIRGIAIGTAVAWLLGAAIVFVLLVTGRSPSKLRLRLKRLRPHRHTAVRIIRVGIPSLAQSSGMWFGNAIVGRIVGLVAAASAATGLMGAHIIAIRVESLSFLPAMAIGTAAATLAGQYLGLGDVERARQAARFCWLTGGGIMAVIGLAFIAFPYELVWLLAPGDAELRAMAAPLIRICGPVQFFFGTSLVLGKAMQGAGDTVGPMRLTYLSTFCIRVPAVYLCAVDDAFGLGYGIGLGLGLTGVWYGLCAELVIRGLLFIARYRRGTWLRAKV